MIILILAAGDQERWGDFNSPKQLIDVGEETLLARMVRQCRERGHEPVIVTHDERLRISERYINPHARRWTCETLLSTRSKWEDRTVVLLGDVIFSADTLDKILCNREPLQIFGRKELRYRIVGRYYEIFALSFDSDKHQCIIDTLECVIEQADEVKQTRGKLRTFYELYCGLPLDLFEHENDIFYAIEDWTEDIDAPEDYVQFQMMIVQRGRLDDVCRFRH